MTDDETVWDRERKDSLAEEKGGSGHKREVKWRYREKFAKSVLPGGGSPFEAIIHRPFGHGRPEEPGPNYPPSMSVFFGM